MSDRNNIFSPEKITIVDFKIVKDQVDTPEDFDSKKIEGHHLNNDLQLGFNLEDKLVKADITIEIRTESEMQNENECIGNFHLVFIYYVENLEDLATRNKNNLIDLHPALGNTLSSITYSTARGVLLTRLQGTALQDLILPIINPNNLLHNNKE